MNTTCSTIGTELKVINIHATSTKCISSTEKKCFFCSCLLYFFLETIFFSVKGNDWMDDGGMMWAFHVLKHTTPHICMCTHKYKILCWLVSTCNIISLLCYNLSRQSHSLSHNSRLFFRERRGSTWMLWWWWWEMCEDSGATLTTFLLISCRFHSCWAFLPNLLRSQSPLPPSRKPPQKHLIFLTRLIHIGILCMHVDVFLSVEWIYFVL